MSRNKHSKKNQPSAEEVIVAMEKSYCITEAQMKDGFCNYTFEVLTGTGAGDTHKVKGTGIALDDLRHTFGKLNVHLAAIDDIFKHTGLEVDDIDTKHTDEHATKYFVTGFKIKGGADNMSVILRGSKHVSVGGRIDLSTPKIALDKLSSYAFWNELKDAVEAARREVELYKEGKYEAVAENTSNALQLTIADNMEDEDIDADFNNAQI